LARDVSACAMRVLMVMWGYVCVLVVGFMVEK